MIANNKSDAEVISSSFELHTKSWIFKFNPYIHVQGGVTPILIVLLSTTAVKVLVKRQSKEAPSNQRSRTLSHNYTINRQEDFTYQK